MKQSIKKFALTTVSLFVAFLAIAQVTTSSMSGRITETNGTPIAGVAVIAIHAPSGTQYYAITDNSGNYRILNMRVGGPYVVEVKSMGYATSKTGNLTLRLGENFVYNAQMTEESVSLSEVVVSAGVVNPILNRDRTGASMNISTREIASLPSISRSITDFTKLTPQANGTSFAGRDGRYNTVTIDGAAFNNNFGLSSNALPGGTSQPISLDAIAEVSVNIAPYDVRQSQFTGASINAVTKSGDNTFKASAYSYIRPKSFTGSKVGDLEVANANERSNLTLGLTLGGPIIKNKLFFFVSAEFEDEQSPSNSYEPSTNGVADEAKKISRTTVADLERAKQHLLDTYGYDPGEYQHFSAFPSQNYKLLARIDWNIADNHKFAFRYNRLINSSKSLTNATSGPPSPVSRSNYSRVSEYAISFSNSFYYQDNTVNAFAAELNSTFGPKFSNKLLVSYTATTDPKRRSDSEYFPFVDIYKDGNPYMSFGYELFTYGNEVNNNTFSVIDNLSVALDNHTLTAGLAYDNIYVRNNYIREGTSYYRYASLDDFINNNARPTAFGITYSYDGNMPKGVELSFGILSAYVQDEWQATKDLKVTYGLRAELPLYHNKLINNPVISEMDFNGYRMDVGSWPESKIQVNPRVGFNWDVIGDRSIQLRGGTGLFTGNLPFVWFTNQPNGSGTIQSPELGIVASGLPADFRFNPDFNDQVSKYPNLFPKTSGILPNNANVAEVSKDFKMPRIWRSNLAADIELPGNMILTLEAVYSKDLKTVVQRNINLPDADRVFTGVDNRAYWSTKKIISTLGTAMLLENSDKGFSSAFTAQLTKNFSNGLSGMLAYTYNYSKDLSANPGSAANSAWQSNLDAFSINDPQLSYSSFAVPHRVVGSLSYRVEYFRNFATTFSVYYNGASQGRASVAYSNDMTNDGVAGDLIYVPASKNEITFVDVVKNGQVVMSASEQADKFWEYVNNDPYLKTRKGEYAERYGYVNPWKNRWDAKILQDIFSNFGTDHRYTLQLSLDIVNAGNLLSKNWGLYTRSGLSNQYSVIMPLTYKGVNNGGAPTFTLNATDLANFDAKNQQINQLTTSSTWGMLLGIRLSF